jgi:MFS family permease
MSRFGRLVVSASVSSLGDGVSRTLVPLLATSVTTAAGVGVIQAVARLPWLLVALPIGHAVDRHGYARILRISLLGKLAGCVVLIAATIGHSFILLAIAAFIVVAGEVSFDTSVHGALPRILPEGRRAAGNGQLYSWQSANGQFLGPAVGGIAGSALGALAPVVPALLHTISLTIRISGERTPVGHDKGSIVASVRLGFKSLYANAGVWWTTVLGTLSMLAYGIWSAVFVTYVTGSRNLDQSAVVFGLLLACPAIGAVAVGLIAGRTVARFTAFVGVVGSIVGQLALFLPPLFGADSLTVAGGMILYGAGLGLWNAGVLSYRQSHIDVAVYARATAAYRVSTWGASPLGAIIGSVLIATFGIEACFIVSGALVFVQVCLAPLARSLKEYRG